MSPFARTAITIAGALAAVACLTAAASPSPAGPSPVATSTRQGVTQVSVSPTQTPMQSPVTVSVSFCLAVPSGAPVSATLTVPAALTPLTSGFELDNTAGQAVAVGKVDGQGVTITSTPAVATGADVCGHVSFPASIRAAQVVANKSNTVHFRSGGVDYPAVFTPVQTLGASPTEPITYGIWTDPADQGRATPMGALTWYLESGRAPQPAGDSSVTFVDTPQAGQTLVCGWARVEIGTLDRYNDFVFVRSYTGQLAVQCAGSRLQVTMGALAPGAVARLVLKTTPAEGPSVAFGNAGSVSVNGAAAQLAKARPVVHYRAVGSVTVDVQTVGAATPSGAAAPAPATVRSVSSVSSVRTVAAAAHTRATTRPSGAAVALLVGLGVVAVGMIGMALRRRESGSAS